MEEAVWTVLAVRQRRAQSTNGRGQIHFEQGKSFVVWETVPELVDVLRGRRIGGVVAGCAI